MNEQAKDVGHIKSHILFQTRDELINVDLAKVVYFEADGNYTKIVFINNCSVLVLTNLGHVESLLDGVLKGKPYLFVRIGRQYIINSRMIFKIDVLHQKLILSDCVNSNVFTLSASKDALKNLKALYIDQSLWK